MKAINRIYHTAATAICIAGLILMMFGAGSSDAGAALGDVARTLLAGLVAFGGGALLRRWQL